MPDYGNLQQLEGDEFLTRSWPVLCCAFMASNNNIII